MIPLNQETGGRISPSPGQDMKRILQWLGGCLLLMALAAACSQKRPQPAHAPAREAAVALGSVDEATRSARAVLAEFLRPGANCAALTMRLKPTSQDYAALFAAPEMAQRAEEEFNELWEDASLMPVRPLPGQTELELWAATREELLQGKGQSARFPMEYKEAAAVLKPGLRLYAWRFVKPGDKPGPLFDGLYQVNGRWIAMPRPWRVTKSAAPPEKRAH